MNKRKLVAVGIAAAAIALAVVSYILLPDMLVMQIGIKGGAGNVMSKPAGIAMPLLLMIGGDAAYMFGSETARKKGIFVVAAGAAVFVLTLIFNL